MYVDLPVWLAAFEDSARGERAADLLAANAGDLEVSLITFLELFLVEESYHFDRERAVTAILELATYDGDPAVLYRADQYRADGLDTFDAFHAAIAGQRPGGADADDAERRWLCLEDVPESQEG